MTTTIDDDYDALILFSLGVFLLTLSFSLFFFLVDLKTVPVDV